MRIKIITGVLLFAVTLAIYWPARHFQMIDLDDPVFMNPDAGLKFDWYGAKRIMTDVVVANWHPVTLFSFVLVRQFYGINPFSEHTVNIFFHAANAALLFLVLMKLTRLRPAKQDYGAAGPVTVEEETGGTPVLRRNIWLCALVAGIFAWHPLRVESVAWISERKDVLYVFFMLLSLLCYAKYAANELKSKKEEGKTDASKNEEKKRLGRNLSWYVLALVFFSLSFMSKATVVTLPFLLLLLDYWPLGRMRSAECGAGDGSNALPPPMRARGKPAKESRVQKETMQTTVIRLIVEKIPFFALAIFSSGLTFWIHQTHMDIRPLGEYTVGERVENTILSYVYYLGKFFWPTRLAVFYPYPTHFDPVQVTLAGMLLLAISALCILQLRRRPYLAVGWFWYLGTMMPVIGLVQIGNQAMADRHTYIPLIGPTISLAWLAAEWAATKAFRRALAVVMAVSMLAVCVVLTRKQLAYWENADRLFSRTIAVTPDNFVAQSCLATALQYEGEYSKAAAHYRVALELLPHHFKTHYQLAVCLAMAGKTDAALAAYRATIAQGGNPNDYVEDMNLADSYEQVGEPEKAVAPLEIAVRLNPDSVKGLDDLAWILATSPDASIRDGARAVALAERACALTGYKQTIFVGTLAAAYAEAGRFDDAVATAKKAIADAQKNGETDLAARNRELLQLYQAHKAYRETR